MHLTHTLPIFINDDSKVLILGSFPSVKSREYGFYYMHPQNRFYTVLFNIFNENFLSSTDERKDFLIRHNIALYDVIEECDISNSEDASIRNVIPIDLESILKSHPNIQIIGVTGRKASELFEKHLKDKCSIRVIYLPSTSPANAKMKIVDLVEAYKELFKN